MRSILLLGMLDDAIWKLPGLGFTFKAPDQRRTHTLRATFRPSPRRNSADSRPVRTNLTLDDLVILLSRNTQPIFPCGPPDSLESSRRSMRIS